MNLTLWLAAYLLPASVAFGFAWVRKSPTQKILIMHAGVAISALLFLIEGIRLHGSLSFLYLIALLVSALFSFLLLGTFGLGYAVSSVLQECCLLLAGITLMPVLGIWPAAFLTSLVFALMHLINTAYWQWKFLSMLLLGALSIVLYVWLRQPLLNIALHILIGSVLIRVGFLSPLQRQRKL